MAKITTKELLDKYFDEVAPKSYHTWRKALDKPEMYNYIDKIGVELVDMDVEQMIGLIKALNPSSTTVQHFRTVLQQIIVYYIDNIELVRNPFTNPKLKGTQLQNILIEEKAVLTWDMVKKAIAKLKAQTNTQKSEYVELIAELFHCGFCDADEIMQIREQNIDFQDMSIAIIGKTIKLSQRCAELLPKVHNYHLSSHKRYIYAIYRDNYIPMYITAEKEDSINEYTPDVYKTRLYKQLTNNLFDSNGDYINYSSLYWLGFYDYLVENTSKEFVDEFVNTECVKVGKSKNKDNDLQTILNYAKLYGVKTESITVIKRFLKRFAR